MRDKAHTLTHLTSFIPYVSNQFNTTIKCIRTDNGSEFLSHQCQTLLSQHGIILERSCPYTPQQNGRVERKHQHLLQLTVPCFSKPTYPCPSGVMPSLPPPTLLTPFHPPCFRGKSPILSCMGKLHPMPYSGCSVCLCYVKTAASPVTKLQPRASRCLFLGYAEAGKGYQVLDLHTRARLISRDVVFYEHIFPYDSSTPTALPQPTSTPTTPYFPYTLLHSPLHLQPLHPLILPHRPVLTHRPRHRLVIHSSRHLLLCNPLTSALVVNHVLRRG